MSFRKLPASGIFFFPTFVEGLRFMLGIPYTITDIARAGIALDLFQGIWPAPVVKYISFDSRTIAHGAETIFIALRTENRNGADYLQQAYDKGVRHFIVEEKPDFRDVNYVIVENALDFLQRWAFHHRLRFDQYPVIAITGSNGKTTVKEWAATLMEEDLRIVKSPMSYNSQLGVAISLLHLRPQADVALIEAGISEVGEMAALAAMIQPDTGVLTHMGDAHQAGFQSFDEKLAEKLSLFQDCQSVLTTAFQADMIQTTATLPWQVIGNREGDRIRLLNATLADNGWNVSIQEEAQEITIEIPLAGQANLENALLSILIARNQNIAWETIQRRIQLLNPVEMRTEIISDHPQVTILNDSYNADADSVRNAFQQLIQTKVQPNRAIILSDLPHQGEQQQTIQQQLLEEAQALVGTTQVYVVGPVFAELTEVNSFPDIHTLQENIDVSHFQHSTVLLKGARTFELEQLIPWLQRKPNATYFRIDLNRLSHNYRFLKSQLPDRVKVMAMVKAASYGSGTWEIAQHLEKEGVEYLAVAYTSEGIELREAGISTPIMVMNPDPGSVSELIRYDLEPEISHLALFERYLAASRLEGSQKMNIHLKLETGMGRLGFQEGDIPGLISMIAQYPDLRVISVMSHLAAADDLNESEFSLSQIDRLNRMADTLTQELGIYPFRHILNTAGMLNFPDHTMDMVRLGIGLYGIDPTESQAANGNLLEIGSLHAFISDINEYPAGTSIGYGRSQVTDRVTRIATVPIGYADGILRSLGNGKASFLVNGVLAPTFGRICMDMLMLDVTEIPQARPGGEVVLFGEQEGAFLSVAEMATAADTIPYEILVRISPRVRRIYDQE